MKETVSLAGSHALWLAADDRLKAIERTLAVRVGARGDAVTIEGDDAAVRAAADVVRALAALREDGVEPDRADFRAAVEMVREGASAEIPRVLGHALHVGPKKMVRPKSPRQAAYLEAMARCDIVLCVGPAGTGKTYLAMAAALAALHAHRVARLVLCRPAVEAGERLGFLPGDIEEKVNPYLRPLYDALYDLLRYEGAKRLLDRGVVEVAPLAFMRGRTLADAFVILDEGQNTTPDQMKMFLTRLGPSSRAVVTGDVTQVDLPKGAVSGLVHARRILADVDGIGIVEMDGRDVVRHDLVSAVIEAYERHGAAGGA